MERAANIGADTRNAMGGAAPVAPGDGGAPMPTIMGGGPEQHMARLVQVLQLLLPDFGNGDEQLRLLPPKAPASKKAKKQGTGVPKAGAPSEAADDAAAKGKGEQDGAGESDGSSSSDDDDDDDDDDQRDGRRKRVVWEMEHVRALCRERERRLQQHMRRSCASAAGPSSGPSPSKRLCTNRGQPKGGIGGPSRPPKPPG